MISVKLEHDLILGKHIATGWVYLTKEKAHQIPEVEGLRVHLCEKDIPVSFYKGAVLHYCEGRKLIPIYPNKDPLTARDL